MALASTGKAMRVTENALADNLPIDVEEISSRTDVALTMRMDSTLRADIYRVTPAIVRHLNVLLDQNLGADEDTEVRALVRKGRDLLNPANRPTADAPAFGAFIYLRDAALLTRRLLWVYVQRNELDAP
ncbi:hypothetical protein [Streptomyces sp. NPDC051567]|uniref:hypothetical protein n=1 Tax=Streptomyces sp. NPDC051567 TaxID=3365660 RepID=UPI0037AC69B6